MSPRPRREDRHPDLQSAIKTTAWDQINEFGANALNLRAISRSLGITAPSIYNYFSNRDALVIALIVDAFNSLAEAQETALVATASEEPSKRLFSLGMAYRNWGVTYPQRFHLIYGTPIPNYHAPDDVTVPAATRGLLPVLSVVQELHSEGSLRTERFAPMTQKLEAMFRSWQQIADGADLEDLYTALVIWSRVHGFVALEIGKQFPPCLDDPAEIFRREMQNMLYQYTGEKYVSK